MTDKERFIALMKDFGVSYDEEPLTDGGVALIIEANVHTKVAGYSGFQSWHCFDKNGTFVEIRINE